MTRSPRKDPHVKPNGAIRKSQLLGAFGPGAMVDLIDDAVVIGGLDHWSFTGKGARSISAPRLREALAPALRNAGRGELSVEHPFREPPTCDDKAPSQQCGVRALEFPQWFVCQNPQCRALVRGRFALERKADHWHHQCTSTHQSPAVPVRFVGACARGHLQDWPWDAFAHRGPHDGDPCPMANLALLEGTSGDFSEIRVVCRTCGTGQSLVSASIPETRPTCVGHRPWLGNDEPEDCEEGLRLLVRTASNGYFAQIMSALSLPSGDSALEDAVASIWDIVATADEHALPVFRRIPKVQVALANFSDADVLQAIEARREGKIAVPGPIRTEEFQRFVAQPEPRPGEHPTPKDDFFARRLPVPAAELPLGFERIVVAHKLREVRAQIGFTRLEPITADLEGEYDATSLQVRAAPLGSDTDWLPAIEIHGEGLFLQLREVDVVAWERRDAVRERERELRTGYEAWATLFRARAGGGSNDAPRDPPPFPGARYFLLHSLAHLLLTAMSLECGYAASALRERIYCASAQSPVPMAAILLMTGTPGAEGTLGGLADQAVRVRAHLRRAFDMGTLCSNDPVCGAHSPATARSDRHLEGAACHGCLFIAECSCERFNAFLDRALVVPTLGQPTQAAFFTRRP